MEGDPGIEPGLFRMVKPNKMGRCQSGVSFEDSSNNHFNLDLTFGRMRDLVKKRYRA